MKKFTFNWGHGIFVFYVVFVAAVVTALVASFGVDHSLVVDDYYATDLAYQEHYEKASHALTDDQLNIQYDAQQEAVELLFGNEGNVNGTIHFYRPSDKDADFKTDITAKKMTLKTQKLQRGKWRLKIEWNDGKLGYYKEHDLYL